MAARGRKIMHTWENKDYEDYENTECWYRYRDILKYRYQIQNRLWKMPKNTEKRYRLQIRHRPITSMELWHLGWIFLPYSRHYYSYRLAINHWTQFWPQKSCTKCPQIDVSSRLPLVWTGDVVHQHRVEGRSFITFMQQNPFYTRSCYKRQYWLFWRGVSTFA